MEKYFLITNRGNPNKMKFDTREEAEKELEKQLEGFTCEFEEGSLRWRMARPHIREIHIKDYEFTKWGLVIKNVPHLRSDNWGEYALSGITILNLYDIRGHMVNNELTEYDYNNWRNVK